MLGNKSQFQNRLIRWYHTHARDLPWRRTRDPYKIWVSEVMLQQTQVDTVIPYYEKWMERFPTLLALAEAPLSEAMKLWAGLGYYRRVRMLHEGACYIVKNLSGTLPRQMEGLLKLPGIGRYTAGALMSIAFGQKVPILDGNVIRIITRTHAIDADVQKFKTLELLWHISETLVPAKVPGDFNQAMMELGATVCFPENPLCAKCPVRKHCAAHAKREETVYPVKGHRVITQTKQTAALICWRGREVLLQKQPQDGRWGGLWMFPHWESEKRMLQETGFRTPQLKRKMTVQHSFTKFRIQLSVFESLLPYRPPVAVESRWVSLENLKDYAFPSPHLKIVGELTQHAR